MSEEEGTAVAEAPQKTTPDKQSKRHLRCEFTDKERLELARQLGEKNTELRRVDADKKRVAKDYGAQTSKIETEIGSLSDKVTSGYELREVECHEFFNQPKVGMKRVVRLDTLEEVGVESMSMEEKQRLLALEEETDPTNPDATTNVGKSIEKAEDDAAEAEAGSEGGEDSEEEES